MQQLEILAWMEAKTWIKRQDLKPLYYSWCLLWNDFKDVTEKNEFDKSVWCVFMVGGYGRTYYSVNCHIYNESCWDFMTQFDCRFTYKKVPCYYYVCLFFLTYLGHICLDIGYFGSTLEYNISCIGVPWSYYMIPALHHGTAKELFL